MSSNENSHDKIFLSDFQGKIDDKFRVTIPAAWRFASTGNEAFPYLATFNPHNGSILVLPPSTVRMMHVNSVAVPLADSHKRAVLREFFRQCKAVTCDSVGRVTLDAAMCQKASLTKEVIFEGEGSCFSIRSEDSRPAPELSQDRSTFIAAMTLVQPTATQVTTSMPRA